MRFPAPGRFKNAAAFAEHWRSLGNDLDCFADLAVSAEVLHRPLSVGPWHLVNRFVCHPMEGWDGTESGLPSEHTLRRWRNFGRSGAPLIWGGEAFAVQEDGRANPNQLYLNPKEDVLGALVALRNEVEQGRREVGEDAGDLVIGLQLTHSGRFSRPEPGPLQAKIAYHHPILDEKFHIAPDAPVLSDGELEAIGEHMVQAACLAAEAGYQFVDVKCCHGYLLHELLGAHRRAGPYGGSFENRTKLFRRILQEIRSRCPQIAVLCRVSIADVVPFQANPDSGIGEPTEDLNALPDWGFGVQRDPDHATDLEEPFQFLNLLQELHVPMVNLSLGSPYYCPHLQRPAAYPPSDGYQPPRDPLMDVAVHLRIARACKKAFPNLVTVGTGYTYLQEYLPHVAAFEVEQGGVDLIGLGRMLLSYPELPLDLLHGRELDRRRICRTFSDCTTAPRNGMISGCYPLDHHYKQLPEADRLKKWKAGYRV